ncbi:MAG: hypothetical protein RID09_18995 [Coleofasciculus sp. G1-WW12-02]|uniref:hypothetical protein n=1 Tax=Coleofasciculus sp. G1-WW12-02 TaxID=3068483 RepID=UPI0032F0B0C7
MLKKAVAYSRVGQKGVRVASGVAENPSEFVRIRQGEITQRWQDFLARLAAQDDFGIGLAEVGKREVTATDLAALTALTGYEHAIVILTDNRRVLINMGSYKGGELPPNTKILLMHSHPDDHGTGMAKFISEDDVNALVYLNQRYSYMVTVDGTVYRFTRDTPSCSVARIVRELKYSGWVKPET